MIIKKRVFNDLEKFEELTKNRIYIQTYRDDTKIYLQKNDIEYGYDLQLLIDNGFIELLENNSNKKLFIVKK